MVKIRITSNPGETFLDRMIALVEGAKRQKTPNEIALTILLSALTLIFLVVLIALKAYGYYANVDFTIPVLVSSARLPDPDDDRRIAERHWHRRDRSTGAEECTGHERPGGGGGGGRGRAAAG